MGIAQIKELVNSVPSYISITCPLARFTKLPFSLSKSHACKEFDLIHIDVWGPYKVATRGKYKYFLTLVDDYSRMIWVYLLQYKSEFLTSFKAFHAYVHTHFDAAVKMIRTDNALEFKDKSCSEFYVAVGILHQTSCPYNP